VYVNHGTTGPKLTCRSAACGARATGIAKRDTMLDAFTEWKSLYVDFSARFSGRKSTTTDHRGQPGGEAARGAAAT
jgi:hypothetical protein